MILTRFAPTKEWIALGFAALAAVVGLVLGLLTGMVGQPLYLFVAFAGLTVGVLTLFYVELGLLALVVLTFTRLSDVLVQYHGAPSVAKLFVPMLLLVVFTRWLLLQKKPAPWTRTAVLLGVYGLVSFASLLYANDAAAAQSAFVNYVKDILIVLVIVMILQKGETLRQVVWALLASGAFLATITTFQHLTGTFTNSYGGFALADVQQIIRGTNDFRIAGPLSSNYYALILVPLVPLAMDRLWHEKSGWLRLLAGWTLLVSVLSIIFTYSRGGFLALVTVVLLMLLRMKLNRFFLLALVLFGLLVWQFLPAQYTDRIGTLGSLVGAGRDTAVTSEVSFRGRLSETTVAWQMFLDHPILGVGLANFSANYQDYSQNYGLDRRLEARAAHSLYLEIAAETGLMGLLAFGAILWFLFRGVAFASQTFKAVNLPDYAHISIALGIALIGYLLGSIFLHLAYARYLWLFIGLGLALPNVARYEWARRQSAPVTAIMQEGEGETKTHPAPAPSLAISPSPASQ
ncbi:MAG: O-antigen ligase family protein [Chloroflexi bacterium]|nr:O-antigen ligase family protein [Chloroflexota bacterium]